MLNARSWRAIITERKVGEVIEIKLEEGDRVEWALKAFKRKVLRSGILKDLRKKRYYVKPSQAKRLKAAAARRRRRSDARRAARATS